jgi:hypothetical protein
MKHMLCASVNRVLEAYHDGELPIEEQIAVESHLSECYLCASHAKSLRMVRDALRASVDVTAEEEADGRLSGNALEASLNAMGAAVVSRVKAEHQQSLPARVSRMFEDLHFVWAALAATTATATCAAVVAGVIYFAPAERDDSLAGMMSALASPGSDRNPMILDNRIMLPRFATEANMPSMPSAEGADVSLAISGVLTQEGRVAFPYLLSSSYGSADDRRVIDAIANARLEPATRGGSPVAVNLVWVFERTTVRGKSS